ASTVIGGTVFQRNTANVANSASLGQFPIVLEPNVPVFVSAGTGNLYPAPGSPIIDSSVDSLADRPSLVAVKQPLGIAASPILAPEYDIHGQLRINDPNVDAPSGLGENIFKDRGAQDRADFVGPSVILQYPIDNDNAGVDQNPDPTIVELTNTSLDRFDIRIVDGIAPGDSQSGTGVLASSVRSSSVLVFRNNVPLVEGLDYRFGYDSTNGVIRLQPLAGIWQTESVYTIRFVNSSESSLVARPASTYTDGDQFTILDQAGSQTIFEFDLGYLVSIPTTNGIDADLNEGTTFVLDDGVRRITYEFDGDGLVEPGNIPVNIGSAPTVTGSLAAIQSAIAGSTINARATTPSNQLQILSDSVLQLDPENSGLLVSGSSGVQTVFGLQMPLEQGIPVGVEDGQTFVIDRSGSPVTFELDTDGSVLPENVPVSFPAGASAAQIGDALVRAIAGAGLGLSPAYDGNGLVRLGGDENTRLDMADTVLTQTGLPGQPAAVKIELPLEATAIEVASSMKSAIDGQQLPGAIVTQFGTRLIISDVQGISGSGANLIEAIRDKAGNPLKANQTDGTTTLTIFMGEGFDYGDAGAPYTSTAADGGPRHTVVDGLHIGPTVTVDADARLVDADLDDGVTFSEFFAAFQSSVTLDVVNTTGDDAYVSLWIDYNGDGFFSSSEQEIAAQVINTPTTVSFIVPPSAVAGQTVARVRISSDAAAVSSPIGDAPDGEVEDWVLTINGNPYTNSRNNLDVNGDGFVSPIDALQVRNYLNDPTTPKELTLPATNVPPYVDVNGDSVVSAIDALLVINYLNELAANGEGEYSELAVFGFGSYQNPATELVLASDWAPSIETVVNKLSLTAKASASQLHDLALLAASADDSDLELAEPANPGAEIGNSADLAWADLAESDSHDDLLGDLLEGLQKGLPR
ncbi:MAG: dockerin type I domain-containing protein, partial [bacterium]|nr:dockerin type I domain-containing protein [bacterium]